VADPTLLEEVILPQQIKDGRIIRDAKKFRDIDGTAYLHLPTNKFPYRRILYAHTRATLFKANAFGWQLETNKVEYLGICEQLSEDLKLKDKEKALEEFEQLYDGVLPGLETTEEKEKKKKEKVAFQRQMDVKVSSIRYSARSISNDLDGKRLEVVANEWKLNSNNIPRIRILDSGRDFYYTLDDKILYALKLARIQNVMGDICVVAPSLWKKIFTSDTDGIVLDVM